MMNSSTWLIMLPLIEGDGKHHGWGASLDGDKRYASHPTIMPKVPLSLPEAAVPPPSEP